MVKKGNMAFSPWAAAKSSPEGSSILSAAPLFLNFILCNFYLKSFHNH